MHLTDYWGVGPKTEALLSEELGAEQAMEAIENADVRALTTAGLSRGRATGIVRRAKSDGDLGVLATRDARDVYKQLLEIIREYAVSRDAMDRVSVMTPYSSPEDAMKRLDRVYEAVEAWEELPDEVREEVLSVYSGLDDGGRKASVEAALELNEVGAEGEAFQRLHSLDVGVLEEALESLTYLDDGVRSGADEELDRLRSSLERVEELESGALDVVEELRSSGVRDVEDLEDAFLDYIVNETGVSYDRVVNAVEEDALDATDFVTASLRNLASDLREEVRSREQVVREELRDNLEDSVEVVEEAVDAVDELGFMLSLARFSIEYGRSRPRFVEHGVGIEEARNLTLEMGGEDVQPVTYGVGEHSVEAPNSDVAVLTGANSGGKTTLLETVCQVVLLAQMGLPVPARDAEVAFFDSLVFHRRHASFNAGVLESTLRSIVPPLADPGSTLMLVDEFEAITEPGSAADLLHGLVTLTVDMDALGMFVTHLADDLEPLPEEGRTDGIFAEGLDSDLGLIVDYQPRFNTVGRSTPEFIVSRLIARAGSAEERMGFETLAEAVGVERVQRTLDEL